MKPNSVETDSWITFQNRKASSHPHCETSADNCSGQRDGYPFQNKTKIKQPLLEGFQQRHLKSGTAMTDDPSTSSPSSTSTSKIQWPHKEGDNHSCQRTAHRFQEEKSTPNKKKIGIASTSLKTRSVQQHEKKEWHRNEWHWQEGKMGRILTSSVWRGGSRWGRCWGARCKWGWGCCRDGVTC